MKRFGRNIFKEGAALQSPGITLNRNYRFIKLNTDPNVNNGIPLPSDPSVLLNRLFTGQQSGVTIKVVEVVPATLPDPATVYVQYTNTLNGVSGATPVSVEPGEDLLEVNGSNVLKVQITNTISNPAVGFGCNIGISDAEFFAVGHFVVAPQQSIILSKYTSDPTEVVGFRVDQEIYTANDDATLFDNQGNLPNLTAPGADRYRISLILTTESQISPTDTFIYVAKVENGHIVESVSGYDQYNKINDYIAVRTKEESGDYTVKPFYLNFTQSTSDPDMLTARMSSGTGYVNGYRISKNTATFFDVPKALDQKVVFNESISGDYGNYIILNSLTGIPSINTFATLTIKNNANFNSPSAITVGTAKVRALEKRSNTEYRLYIFDIAMNQGYFFQTSAKSIGENGSNYGVIKLEGPVAKIYEADKSNVFFSFPKDRPLSLSNISMVRGSRFTGVVSPNGEITLTGPSSEIFTDNNDWIISLDNGVLEGDMSNFTFTGLGTNAITISGFPAYYGNGFGVGSTVSVMAFTYKAQTTVATKSKTTITQTYTYNPSVGYVNLFYPDIISIDEVRIGNSTGQLITTLFDLDNGQRDGYYEEGRLIVKPSSQVSPGGGVITLSVKFTYFARGPGDFFAPSSYVNIGYDEIPSYSTKNGTVVDLRNVLDFRSTRGGQGNFTDPDAQLFRLPKDASIISADVNYYLPRYDKIVLDDLGYFKHIAGTPDFEPKFPPTPSKSMELYRIRMNPGTISNKDLTTRLVENKRYTMRDIGKIEKRIDKLEEQTSLSLLELDTSNISVLDADGNNRTKSGFLADNFSNQFYSAVNHPEYRAANDPQKKIIRPQGIVNNIGLYLDEDISPSVVLKGDNIYLPYTDEVYVNQTLATGTINCQPLINMFFRGTITLSPASDDWKETEYLADNVIDGGTRINTDLALQWNEWNWNWGGVDINDLQVGSTQSFQREINRTARSTSNQAGNVITNESWEDVTTETVVNTVSSSETIREVIGDRIVDISLIPFMRSKLVYFRAEGLQPNSEVFPFFDGVLVSDWCKMEPYSNYNITKQTEYGNLHKHATQHPLGGGPTRLFTDGKGSVEGSFFIPSQEASSANSNPLRFRTGEAEFVLIDISVLNPSDCVSFAKSIFSSTGLLYTRQLDVLSTRILTVTGSTNRSTERENVNVTRTVIPEPEPDRDRGNDPVAQSFFVSEDTGVFITKIGLFFAAKDTGSEGQDALPVQVQIRQMINGIPSQDLALPGSIVTIPASSVGISADASVETIAVFEEPVFLAPQNEYCVVIKTDSTRYETFISKMGDFVLGTTTKRVNTQPFLGSFFKSQNNKTWDPEQYTDLTFKIYKAEFEASGVAYLKNVPVPRKLLSEDPINFYYDSDHTLVKIDHRGTGLDVGDTVIIQGAEGSLASQLNNQSLNVVNVDPTGFVVEIPTLSQPTPYARVKTGGIGVSVNQSYRYELMWPGIEDLKPNDTNIRYSAITTSGRSYAGLETGNIIETSYRDIMLKQNNNYDSTRLVTYNEKRPSSLVIKAEMSSTSKNVSPVIDLQRASATLVGNLIDNPSGQGTVGTNTSIIFVPETGEGSAAAKHITIPVTLSTSAVGLKILMGATRPAACGIRMFYRVSDENPYSTSERRALTLDEVPWEEIDPDDPVPSDENSEIYREYRYTVGGETGLSESFTQFQLKVVMVSSNNAKVPILRDLRIIALGD
jgi:hypothetical protein